MEPGRAAPTSGTKRISIGGTEGGRRPPGQRRRHRPPQPAQFEAINPYGTLAADRGAAQRQAALPAHGRGLEFDRVHELGGMSDQIIFFVVFALMGSY